MDKGTILDKVYVALELTKISYNNRENIINEEVYNTFNSYMSLLCDTKLEELDKIKEYKRKIIGLQQENFKLQNEFNDKLDEIMERTFMEANKILDSSKQDMEVYVYNNLKALLNNKK